MLVNNVDKKLKEIGKTRHWLSLQLGITYANTIKIAKNETVSIRFDIMEKLCDVFNCTLDELFTIQK